MNARMSVSISVCLFEEYYHSLQCLRLACFCFVLCCIILCRLICVVDPLLLARVIDSLHLMIFPHTAVAASCFSTRQTLSSLADRKSLDFSLLSRAKLLPREFCCCEFSARVWREIACGKQKVFKT